MTYPPSALFVPAPPHGDDFEQSHQGVAIRRRAGKVEHIAPVSHEHDLLDEGLMRYQLREVPGRKSGLVQPDDVRGGYWLVPEKVVKAFRAAWKAEQDERKARADAEAARVAAMSKAGSTSANGGV